MEQKQNLIQETPEPASSAGAITRAFEPRCPVCGGFGDYPIYAVGTGEFVKSIPCPEGCAS